MADRPIHEIVDDTIRSVIESTRRTVTRAKTRDERIEDLARRRELSEKVRADEQRRIQLQKEQQRLNEQRAAFARQASAPHTERQATAQLDRAQQLLDSLPEDPT